MKPNTLKDMQFYLFDIYEVLQSFTATGNCLKYTKISNEEDRME